MSHSSHPKATGSAGLERTLQQICEPIPGTVGVYAESLDGDDSVSINAGEIFPTASSVKMFILYTLLRGVDLQQISLRERVEYPTMFSTPGSGVMTHLDPGLRPTLKDLATLMMMISDNTATNILIDYLGLGTINECIADVPLNNTRIGSWMNFRDSDRDSYTLGSSTPREMAGFLAAIRDGELLSDAMSSIFWDILRIQKYIKPLRQHLPASPWAREWEQPEPVWVASKSGNLIDCTTESGLIHAHNREWSISIMTRDLPNVDETPHEIGENLIADISLAVFRAWSPAI